MNLTSIWDGDGCVRFVLTLAHFLWQATAIALAAAIAGWLLSGRSARLRYGVFLAALALMAAAPLATFPLVRAPVHPAKAAPAATVAGPAEAQKPTVSSADRRNDRPAPPGSNDRYAGSDALASAPAALPIGGTRPASAAPSWWGRFAPHTTFAYLIGVSLMLIRLLLTLRGGRRLRRLAQPVRDGDLLGAVDRAAKRIALRSAPLVAYCRQVAGPTVVGVFAPMVLLPMSFATGLTAEQVEAILIHELAHIRRLDPLVNLLQRLLEAAMFFHPAVWVISRRIRIERENCCDDVVLAAGGRRCSYAAGLVRLAELSLARPALVAAAATLAATGKPSELRRRVLRLLGGPAEGQRLWRCWPVALALAAAVLLGGSAVLTARVQKAAGPGTARSAPAKPDDAPKPAPKQAWINLSGRVVDDKTGEPIDRFTLQWGSPTGDDPNQLVWGGRTALSSGRAGRFSTEEGCLEGDKAWIRVLADGYLPEPLTLKPIIASATLKGLVIRLKRGGAIRGRVVDHKGAPVSEASVFLAGNQELNLTDGEPERFTGSSARTDKDGRFAMTGAGAEAASIVVSTKGLHVWRVDAPEAGKEVTIELPEPATLVLRYDIEGDEAQAHLRLELKTWALPGWKDAVRSVQEPVAANKGEVVVPNVTPGVYDLARMKRLRLGDTGRGILCDRRTVVLESGKTLRADFIRKAGWPIFGELIGLAEANAPGAYVTVKSAGATGDPLRPEERKLTTFDVLTSDPDGWFRTACIPPGSYTVIAEAHAPEPVSTGVRLPGLVGTAEVTVRADVRPARVQILMKPPTQPRGGAAATAPAVRADQLPRLWDALAGKDAVKAYEATQTMVRCGDEAVAFLEGQLKPASMQSARAQRLVADLDSQEHAVRQRAMDELHFLHKAAEPVLREALRAGPSAEKRERIEVLLKACAASAPAAPELRRIESAVRVLERAASQNARRALKGLAEGTPGAFVTEEARAALQRLAPAPAAPGGSTVRPNAP